MLNSALPLVSCLCVSKNDLNILKRSFNCFKNQTYKNKELIIVYDKENVEVDLFISSLNDSEVFSYTLVDYSEIPLGDIRNFSLQKANGEYFCQWDDDDWYHNDRLEVQMQFLTISSKSACVLMYEIIYHCESNRAFRSAVRTWEHSLICKKSVLSNALKYNSKNKGEDYDFVKILIENKLLYPIVMPHLYIYVYHGKNTWDENHFNNLIYQSVPYSNKCSDLIKDILEDKFSNDEASDHLSKFILEEINYFDLSE